MEVIYDDTLSDLFEGQESPHSRAFGYALDISYNAYKTMSKTGMKNKDLADRLGVSESRVSQILNMQPNMTLETIARLEIALDTNLISTDAKDSARDEKPEYCPDCVRSVQKMQKTHETFKREAA